MIVIIEEATGQRKRMSSVYAMDLIKRGKAKLIDIAKPEPSEPAKPVKAKRK